MSILPPWSGDGAIPDAEVVNVAAAEREGWTALRSLQSDPLCDILRYVKTSGDPARGVPATRTPVPDLEGLPVLWSTLTEMESRAFGGVDFETGDRRFEFFTGVEVLKTDEIRFPSSTGKVWRVTGSYYDADLGQCIVFVRLANR